MGAALRNLAQLPLFIGFARAIDMFGALNEPIQDPGSAAQQMQRDWQAIGHDFHNAMPDDEEVTQQDLATTS